MEEPTLVRILRILQDKGGKASEEEIRGALSGEKPAYIDRAFEELRNRGILRREGDLWEISSSPEIEALVQKLFALYEKVARAAKKEMLVRGILSRTSWHYLLRFEVLLEILEQEGFEREEIREFIQKEVERGYIEKFKVVWVGKASGAPIFMPSYYLSYLAYISPEEYRKLRGNTSVPVFEDEYLLGKYPDEVAAPAREYMEREHKELCNMLRERAFFHWL